MTSLAKQLQRLAVPHVQSVFAEDKRRKSLLFDPKEAASLDKETFYALGINGLDELQTLDDVFQQFETTLFAESSLTFERSIQTKEVNEKLDENISRFLSLLSPYCLLKPAHKALEWLIYRYHIHMYNVDDLMMCLLPYHESKIFVRAVQLLNLDSKTSSKWDWLDTIQVSGIHLSTSVLVNHCWTNIGFLSLLCDNVQKNVKIHLNESEKAKQLHVLFSFYATTVIGVLEFGKITENLISTLILHISTGLRSKVMDYKAATYMILAQLFYKTKLKSELTTTLLNVLCKRLFAPLIKEATSCLLLMFQTQEVSKFTKKSFKYLCKHSGFVEAVISLSADFKADKLLVALFEKVIPAAIKQNADIASSGSEGSDSEYEGSLVQYPSMLYRLISNIHMSDHVAEEAARRLLKSYVNYRQTLQADETKLFNSQLRNVIRIMEGRYSNAVEKAIEEVLSEAQSDEDRSIIKDFLNLSVLSVQHHMIADSDASLTLSLNHRLPMVRQSAVKHLLEFADTSDDPSYLSESILLRLRDDSPAVVEAVLQKPQVLWNSMTDKKALLEGLDLVLMKADSKAQWQRVGELAVSALGECQVDEDMELDVQSMLLPNLLVLTDSVDREGHQVDQLLQSTFAKKNTLLSFIAKNWKGKGNLSPKKSNKAGTGTLSVNNKMVETIGKGLMEYRHKDRDAVIRKLCEKSSNKRPRFQCVLLLILDKLISMTTGQTEKLDLCHLQLTLIKSVQTSTIQENMSDIMSLDECLVITFKSLRDEGKLPSCLPVVMIHRLIAGCSVPKQLLTGRDFWEYKDDSSISDKYLNLCINMLDFIMENTTVESRDFIMYRQLVVEFMQVFTDQKTLFKFLGLLWTQHCNDSNHGITSVLQARALQLGKVHIERLVNMEHQTQAACIPTALVSLMSVLTSKHQGLRQVAIDCLSSLMSSLNTVGSTFIPLVRKIIRCSQEIIEDPDYLTEVLKAFFKATGSVQDEDGKSPRKKAKHSGKKEAKQDALNDLTRIIVSSETPDYIQRTLLKILQLHNNSDMLEHLLPLLHKLLHHQKQQSQTNTTNYDCVSLILARYTVDTASMLKSDSKGLELLLLAMTMKNSCGGRKQLIQELAINQISKDFYSELKSDSQQKIFASLVDALVSSPNPEVSNKVRKIMKHIILDAEHAVLELQAYLKMSTIATVKEAKRRSVKSSQTETSDNFEDETWQRVTIILECLQGKKKLINFASVLPVCFQIMSRVLDSDHHSAAEYLKQLVLSVTHQVCDKASKEDNTEDLVPEQKFNMEKIVQCIRTSDNPQTHHQALLVLTTAAKIYPEKLLHNIMSVFTFMGANILRQDDEYSFKIITRILETVIPALVTACEQRTRVPKTISNKVEDVITMVIRVFVDAFPHIPEHRRLMMFTKLVQTVGDEHYLWRTVLLLTEQIINKDQQSAESKENQLVPIKEFSLQLCDQFSPSIQLVAASEIVMYISGLPDEKEDDSSVKKKILPQSLGKLKKEDTELFNIVLHTGKQLRHYKYENILFLISLVSSEGFIRQVAMHQESDLLQKFQQLLESILKYVTQISKASERYHDRPTGKFWKALLNKVHDLLDKVVSLLPEGMFVDVVSGLMDHPVSSVQRKSMELLNNRLHQHRETLKPEKENLLLPLVDKLTKIVEMTTLCDNVTDAESGQTALYSLKLLCRNLGANHPFMFLKVLRMGTQVLSKREDNLQVSACALLCIAEICNNIKVHVIPYLSTFIPGVLTSMKDKEKLYSNELFLLSSVTTLQKVIENMSNFLSPYLKDIVYEVCSLSCANPEREMLEKPQVQQRLKVIRSTLATMVPPRVILPVVTECYPLLADNEQNCVKPLMSLLIEHINCMTKDDLNSNINDIQTFFLECLNYRISHSQVEQETIEEIEGDVIQTIIAMVMKLSESTFKPFLFKLYDWATGEDASKLRVLVFYRLAESLAEKLRSLFTLFAGHIVKHAATVLDKNNISKGKPYFGKKKANRKLSRQLLHYMLGCLHKCFMYDTEGFVNKERFDTLLQPLVDQIENELGSETCYENRVTEYLTPCIVQFGVAAQDDALWRSLNYQILLKTRHSSPKVRFATLHVIDEFHKKLGEDYMTLLPETIPFLAELMEDESEEVEKKCQSVIGEMEKTLGEPLQKYF